MFFYTFMPKLFNMSLTASVAIVLVILLRLLLKKAPKVISYALWGVVLFRLLCPVSIGSSFSLYNLFDTPTEESGTVTSVIEYVPSNIVHTEYPSVALPVPGISDAINEALPQGREQLVADPLEAPMSIATYVWMIGVLGMVIYSIVSYVRLRSKLSVVVPLRDNIFIADDIKSPFVVGLFRPKIYLPCNLGDKEQEYIILHEQHHIRRLDHVMKALAFLALAIHWFNPLVWVAFILASKDMEMSCDEAVIRKVGGDVRADYSASLLTLATGRRIIAGTPLAFGEGDTKGRINNLSKWKKPAVWVVLIAVVACIVLAVSLLTNPAAKREFPINGSNVSELDTEWVVEMIARAEKLEDGSQLCVNEDGFDLMFTSDFDWANDGAIRFFYYGKNQKIYSAQLRMFHDDNKYFITESSEWIEQEQIFKLFHYLDALKYMPQEELRQLSPDADGYSVFMRHEGAPSDYERVLKYSQDGIKDSGGWNIHLEVQPLHKVESGGYNGSGDEVVHLFYEDTSIAATENASRDLLSTDKIVMAYYGGHAESPIERTITNSADISNLLSMYQSLEVKKYSRPLSEVRLVLQFYSGDKKTLDWKVSYYEEDDTVVTSSDGFGLGNRLVINDFSYDELMAFYQCGSITMIPTATKLLGSQAGAILVPINGETFRYLLTDESNQYQSTDQLLYTFAEETGAEDIIWEVYALKEYPDLSVVLMVSETNGSWLCRYSPPGSCVDTALTEAVDAGYVILEDGVATHGQNRWKEFYTRTQSGKNATVSVAHYFTLDPERCDPAYYEVFNQDYPYMSIYHLSYDGNVFTLSFTDGGVHYNKTYEYLMRYDATRFSPISATRPKETTRYVLTHSNTVTWEQLFNGMVSSQFGAYIDHHSIYTEQNSQ